MRRSLPLTYALLIPMILLLALFGVRAPLIAAANMASGSTPQVYLPVTRRDPTPTFTPTNTPAPTATPAPTDTPNPTPTGGGSAGFQWDPRLDDRHILLTRAQPLPGQWYWRLVKGVWYAENEPPVAGQHHIFVDTWDAAGARQPGVAVQFASADGAQVFQVLNTEAKPGELYAGNFPMYYPGVYRARPVPSNGAPADMVSGMKMGDDTNPKLHTSFGFVWQWTQAGSESAGTPLPGATATPPTPASTPTTAPNPGAVPTPNWDPQLTQRGAVWVPANVKAGQGYWHLVDAQWYDVNDAPMQGQGLIMADVRDTAGYRWTGIPVRISSNDGGSTLATITTEAKPGDMYAAYFSMYELAPTYRAAPNDGSPADAVYGMGLGSVSQPGSKLATRYGLTWQWTIAAGSSQPTSTPEPAPTAGPTPVGTYQFNTSILVKCDPQAGGTWFGGTVKQNGQPANGYRVVYSSTPDGTWSTNPVISGPHTGYPNWNPGYYSHMISVSYPIAGDWYVWVADAAGTRISVIQHWHSTGPGSGGCNDATINFDS